MKIKSHGHTPEFLKRKAKALSKATGISHIQSLDQIASDYGYSNWRNFVNNQPGKAVSLTTIVRPTLPDPVVLNYHNSWTGAIIGQHPNRKMPVRSHKKVGKLLQELIDGLEYHKRAKNVLYDIRRIMDTWLGCEYSEAELSNKEFMPIYYGRNGRHAIQGTLVRHQAILKRKMRAVRILLDSCYHDCKPLDYLHKRFDLAEKLLEKWPIVASTKFHVKAPIPTGTFVRLVKKKMIGLVFNYNQANQIVHGYSDGGHFSADRNDVTILKRQPLLRDFKPMRLHLPYGKWICSDGSEVLFNRDYCPIWEKLPGGIVRDIQPNKYISYVDSEFYYNDRTAPYYNNPGTVERCLSVLEDWGVANSISQVLELIPSAMALGDAKILSPKGIS